VCGDGLDQTASCIFPSGDIFEGSEFAFPGFIDDLMKPTHASGQHGDAAGLGFKDDIGQAFVSAGHAEKVGGAHPAGDVLSQKRAGALKGGTKAEGAGEFICRRFERAFANHHEAETVFGQAVNEGREVANQAEGILHGQEVSNEEEKVFFGIDAEFGTCFSPALTVEEAGLHAVVNRVQFFRGGTSGGQKLGKAATSGDDAVHGGKGVKDGPPTGGGAEISVHVTALRDE
jgi:hypothetical protein